MPLSFAFGGTGILGIFPVTCGPVDRVFIFVELEVGFGLFQTV